MTFAISILTGCGFIVFIIALNEAHIKIEKLEREIRYIYADMRIQQQVNDSLRSQVNSILKMSMSSILEHEGAK